MKKNPLCTFILFLLPLSVASADSADLFCSGDSTTYSAMVSCHLNQIDDCRDAYPTCSYNDFQQYPSTVISNLIDRCCKKTGDSAQDACFLRQVRALRRAKGIPVKFRKDVAQRIKAYIQNPELQCTEA